jgi:hypothetical protein
MTLYLRENRDLGITYNSYLLASEVQSSIMILLSLPKCETLFVTIIISLAIAVDPISISKSSIISPVFLNRAFSFA